MTVPLDQQQREDVRHAALKFLADRPRLAFAPASVAHMIYRKGLIDFMPDVAAVEAALRLLQGMELVDELVDQLGASLTYRVTAKGVLHHEREVAG